MGAVFTKEGYVLHAATAVGKVSAAIDQHTARVIRLGKKNSTLESGGGVTTVERPSPASEIQTETDSENHAFSTSRYTQAEAAKTSQHDQKPAPLFIMRLFWSRLLGFCVSTQLSFFFSNWVLVRAPRGWMFISGSPRKFFFVRFTPPLCLACCFPNCLQTPCRTPATTGTAMRLRIGPCA